MKYFSYTLFGILFLVAPQVSAQTINVGFSIPSVQEVLGFMIRGFFLIAILMALFYMLTGALAWVTSGGGKEAVEKAREKISASLVGLILIVVVLAIIWTMEQTVFDGNICIGISCDPSIPSLLGTPTP